MAIQADMLHSNNEIATGARPAHTAEPLLPLTLCISFGIGSLGIAILLNVVTTFLPALLSTVLGQSAALGGALLTFSKVYDLLVDVGIGVVSDRTRSRMGRRRPYMLLGAILGGASLLPIFMAPAIGHVPLVLWIGFALMVYSTGYSLFSVPYMAMVGEITVGYHERTRLMSFGSFFVAVGQLTASAGAAWLIGKFGGGRVGYAGMAVVTGLTVFASMVAAVVGTRGARRIAYVPKPATMTRFEGMRTLLSCRPFVVLMLVKVLQNVALAIMFTTLLLFFLNALRIGYRGLINMAVVENVVICLSMPIWVRLARHFGKRPAYLAATALLALVYGSWFLARPGLPISSVWIRGGVSGFAAAGVILVSVSMIPDIMDYDSRLTGRRREGVFASAFAIVEKLGFALGAGISGLILAHAGYLPTTGGRVVHQPGSAIAALYANSSLVPMLLILGSCVVLFFYPLSEKRLLATGRQPDSAG